MIYRTNKYLGRTLFETSSVLDDEDIDIYNNDGDSGDDGGGGGDGDGDDGFDWDDLNKYRDALLNWLNTNDNYNLIIYPIARLLDDVEPEIEDYIDIAKFDGYNIEPYVMSEFSWKFEIGNSYYTIVDNLRKSNINKVLKVENFYQKADDLVLVGYLIYLCSYYRLNMKFIINNINFVTQSYINKNEHVGYINDMIIHYSKEEIHSSGYKDINVKNVAIDNFDIESHAWQLYNGGLLFRCKVNFDASVKLITVNE